MNADEILTADCLAAIRLPVSVSQFGAIAKAFPDTVVTQRGPFLVILKPTSKP